MTRFRSLGRIATILIVLVFCPPSFFEIRPAARTRNETRLPENRSIGSERRDAPSPSERKSFMGRPTFKIYDEKDGLPQVSILSATIDRNGYFWVGTQDGAAYFNGHAWHPVNMPNRRLSNYVKAVYCGTNGDMWFGKREEGVSRLAAGRWTTYTKQNGLPNNSVNCILETRLKSGETVVFAGTDDGLAVFDGTTWKKHGHADGLPGARINCLMKSRTPDGTPTVWAGTNAGASVFDGRTWTRVELPAELAAASVLSLSEGGDETGGKKIWVGTNKGFTALGGPDARVHRPAADLAGNVIRDLIEIKDGNGKPVLWVGTENGLYRFVNGDMTTYDTTFGLPSNLVRCLSKTTDSNGTTMLWIGTGNGLVRFLDGSWTSLDKRDGLPDNNVFSFLETKSDSGEGRLWIGTEGGLACRANDSWTIHTTNTGLPNNRVLCLIQTGGAVWAGTSSGLAQVVDGTVKPVPDPSGFFEKSIRCFLKFETKTGEPGLLVGTQDGLYKLEKNTWSEDTDLRALPSAAVLSLHESVDPDGGKVLWIGTEAGLVGKRNGRLTVHNVDTGLPNNIVRTILETRTSGGKRFLWVGTSGGAARCDLAQPTPTWEILSDASRPALPSNIVSRICADRLGRVYLTTNRGVVRLSEPQTESDRLETLKINTFTTEDGLPSKECNSGASLVDSAGRIWVGTVGGAAVLDPSMEQPHRESKPLFFEGVEVSSKQGIIRFGTGLDPDAAEEKNLSELTSLAHDQNDLTFRYALLSFFREAETTYRTQLVGYESTASEWTLENKRIFTNLPPGSYTFTVFARDYAGNEAQPATIAFRIRPSPWQTWWAYALYAAAAAGGGYLVTRFRFRTLRLQNERLEAKVRERTAEIAEKVELLKASEREALRAREEALEEKRKALESEGEALEARNRAVEANRAKTTFLANMSHELRTPLNAVIGFAQVMERETKRSPEDLENLAVIRRSGESLLDLINDVLEVSRIEAGRMTLHETSYPIRKLLGNLREMFEVRSSTKGLRFFFDLSNRMPEYVHGDENKLRQVLVKLLGNAFKYTGHGHVAFRADWKDGMGRFVIEDSGQGIASDELEVIFHPFKKGANEREFADGIGLGLTISRKYVDLMGGDIEVTSKVGKGSSFTVTVPLPEADACLGDLETGKIVGLASPEPTHRILAADGKWENCALLSKILIPVGFEVKTASDGPEAFAAYREWEPDVVLLDARLPIWNGLETAERIRVHSSGLRDARESEEGKRWFVALLSNTYEHDREALTKAGFDRVLLKPFKENELFELLRELLKVEYTFETPLSDQQEKLQTGDVPLTPARLAVLPKDLLMAFYQTVNEGNIFGAQEVADRISQIDELLARDIRSYIRNYRFDDLVDLIELVKT